jgi:alginate O-acetyltransferase complex protein AlgI
MLFNSLAFAIFLPVVFALFWSLNGRLRLQNMLLLAASYLFYGWWDWRFLLLIVASSSVDYVAAILIGATENPRRRKQLLLVSIGVNLGILGFFKYFDFFIQSFTDLVRLAGFHADPWTLRIILPVGISFYTFQTLSYTVDVYRRDMEATRDWLAFFTYVAFFPQLVAGPIERARNLLPQFQARRTFDVALAKDGLRRILWGLFKKVVIADNLAPMVEHIFTKYDSFPPPVLLLGVFFFAIQIYCDFSGYSEIAIGCARLLGFDLMRNFAYPYFSRDMGEFWRRWHISLSTWFRDYVYIPLGGSRSTSRLRHLANVMITFTVSGFWHGSNWTFVVWGFLNGLYYLPVVLSRRHERRAAIVAEGRFLPTMRELLQLAMTFSLALLAWVFFRADSLTHAFTYLERIFTTTWFEPLQFRRGIPYAVLILGIEWIQRERQHALEIDAMPLPVRWAAYYAVAVAMLFFGSTGHVPFIYFQF